MEVFVKMYNGGDRFQGSLSFSLVDGHDNACLGKWSFDAPAKSFFEVPVVFALSNGSEISTKFPDDILRLYPKTGVIYVNPSFKGEIPSHIPVAKNEEEAIIKGNALWEDYLRDVCLKWYAHCDQIRAAGGQAQAASGFTKRALKELKMADPGQAAFEAAARQATSNAAPSGNADVAALIAQVQALASQVATLTATKKLREDADKESDDRMELEAVLEGQSEPAKKSKK